MQRSPTETARFGIEVGRIDLAELVQLDELEASLEGFDLVILRANASWRSLPSKLASLTKHRVITADHLCYWEWIEQRFEPAPLPAGASVKPTDDTELVSSLVVQTFDGYANHYAANPLLDASHITAGYEEWVTGLLASEGSTCLVLSAANGQPIGFAVVDWSASPPDIRLAGVVPSFQGQGLYGPLLSAAMSEATGRGHGVIEISTQSDNTNVMRSWARLGLLPNRTVATHHIVVGSLLDERGLPEG